VDQIAWASAANESHDRVMPKARPQTETFRKSIVIDQRE
jgi:hypothetical protein